MSRKTISQKVSNKTIAVFCNGMNHFPELNICQTFWPVNTLVFLKQERMCSERVHEWRVGERERIQ